jgi:hypothetical protein
MMISHPPEMPTAKLNGSRCSANDAEYSDSTRMTDICLLIADESPREH